MCIQNQVEQCGLVLHRINVFCFIKCRYIVTIDWSSSIVLFVWLYTCLSNPQSSAPEQRAYCGFNNSSFVYNKQRFSNKACHATPVDQLFYAMPLINTYPFFFYTTGNTCIFLTFRYHCNYKYILVF